MNEILSTRAQNNEFCFQCDAIILGNLSSDAIISANPSEAEIDNLLSENQKSIDEINAEIEKVTCHADGLDYLTAAISGIVTGLIDIFFVGQWNFSEAKAWSNENVNKQIMEFANKQAKKDGKKPFQRLSDAITYLEKKYKLPGDNEWKGITSSTIDHHLDDWCHHPTLIGLISCLIVQFTGEATYRDRTGLTTKVPVIVNEYGNFVGSNPVSKVFAGIINWFIVCAKTIANRKGHLYSDLGGSKTTAKKGKDGSGVPGSFVSILKELSALPCFKDTNFANNLHKAFVNGIGEGKNQLNFGPFNALFEGASSKLDFRTEKAIGHELKKQAIPVILNEMFVRSAYSIRRFINQMKSGKSILEIEWNELIPFNNGTITRMMTVASGTFMTVDVLDATIRSGVKNGFQVESPLFWKDLILRINFVGIGRFALAVGADLTMGARKEIKRNERIRLLSERAYLLDAKIEYKRAENWIVIEQLESTYDTLEQTVQNSCSVAAQDINEILQSGVNISNTLGPAIEKNPEIETMIKNIFEN